MDLIFDFANLGAEDEFTDSKSDVLKYLKIIGVDTRFISYTPDKIYINNLRFSKFSRTREKTFNSQYPNIEVVRSSLFQKICSKSSKILANVKPKDKILVPDIELPLNNLMYIILEPYTRKYGIDLVFEGNYDLIAKPLTLDGAVNNIFLDIFNGNGIDFEKKEKKTIYPLINVSNEWINSFLSTIIIENPKNQATDFMDFLDDVAPQYRENVLKASEYIEAKLKIEK